MAPRAETSDVAIHPSMAPIPPRDPKYCLVYLETHLLRLLESYRETVMYQVRSFSGERRHLQQPRAASSEAILHRLRDPLEKQTHIRQPLGVCSEGQLRGLLEARLEHRLRLLLLPMFTVFHGVISLQHRLFQWHHTENFQVRLMACSHSTILSRQVEPEPPSSQTLPVS